MGAPTVCQPSSSDSKHIYVLSHIWLKYDVKQQINQTNQTQSLHCNWVDIILMSLELRSMQCEQIDEYWDKLTHLVAYTRHMWRNQGINVGKGSITIRRTPLPSILVNFSTVTFFRRMWTFIYSNRRHHKRVGWNRTAWVYPSSVNIITLQNVVLVVSVKFFEYKHSLVVIVILYIKMKLNLYIMKAT